MRLCWLSVTRNAHKRTVLFTRTHHIDFFLFSTCSTGISSRITRKRCLARLSVYSIETLREWLVQSQVCRLCEKRQAFKTETETTHTKKSNSQEHCCCKSQRSALKDSEKNEWNPRPYETFDNFERFYVSAMEEINKLNWTFLLYFLLLLVLFVILITKSNQYLDIVWSSEHRK